MARTVEQIVEEHSANLVAGDLEAVMSDFCEESFMITPQGIIKGLDALRTHFDNTIKYVLTPDVKTQNVLVRAEGNIGYVIWKAEGDRFSIPFATDTFVIENDKIMVQTFGSVVNKK